MPDPKDEPKPEPPQELTETEADKVSGGVGRLQKGLDPSKQGLTIVTAGKPSPLGGDQGQLAGGRIL